MQSAGVELGSILPRYLAVCAALFFAATGLALFMGRWLAGRVMEPVNRLSQAMREVTDSADYSQRLPIWAQDEFGLLTESFNHLLAQLHANDNALHRAMTELVSARDAAQAANVLKSQFLANMSHEIRTPLNGVLAMAQIISIGELSDVQRERVDIIRRSGEDLLSILNDILDLSKIEAGKMEIEVGEIDVEALGRNVHATFGAMAASKPDLRFVLEIGPDAAGTAPGRSDPHQPDPLQTAVQRAQIHRRRRGAGGDRRGRRRRPRRPAPGGLGHRDRHRSREASDAVREIHSGGRLEHPPLRRHRPGIGHLPRTRPHHARDHRGGERRGRGLNLHRQSAGAADRRRRGRRQAAPAAPETAERALRVLAAEDIPTNQLVLRTIMQTFGVELDMVDNGREAVDAWKRGDFDLILMDIQMPEMDGLTATKLIRAAEAASGRPRTPIIAVSANAMHHQVAEYLAAGMDAHVAKPIELTKLHAAIEAAFTTQRQAAVA